VQKIVLPLLVVLVVSAWAGFQVKGKVSDVWDNHSFKVQTGSEMTKLWFTVPAKSAIGVSVKGDSGDARTATLTMNSSFDLEGAGKFTVTVARDSGAGEWACKDLSGAAQLLEFESYVDPKYSVRFTVDAEEDKETWTFTYPSDATFLVRQVGPSGRVTEEQDLSDEANVELAGGGSFTLEVAATEGSGKFTATLAK
jgi:hypothetical protein